MATAGTKLATSADLVDKFQVLHTNQIPHYWIADPVEKALELRISVLFGIEDEEE